MNESVAESRADRPSTTVHRRFHVAGARLVNGEPGEWTLLDTYQSRVRATRAANVARRHWDVTEVFDSMAHPGCVTRTQFDDTTGVLGRTVARRAR